MSNTRRHPVTQLHDELGQTLAEYSILIAAIAVVVAVALPLLGANISGLFSTLAGAFGG